MNVSLHKIIPFLWFDNQAKEAADFYLSVFPDSKLVSSEQYSETPSGVVETYTIELVGQRFTLMSAGGHFKINEAISFVIDCENQDEVDYYWERLTSDGGEESMCGWLKDRFGVSWQVTPKGLTELTSHENKEKAKRAFEKMLTMKKIIISEIEDAFNSVKD